MRLAPSTGKPRQQSHSTLSRRHFVRVGTAAIAGAATQRLQSQSAPTLLPPYIADINGDGRVGRADEDIVRAARFSQRGFSLEPSKHFDYRLDVFGRASVTNPSVDSVLHSLDYYKRHPPKNNPPATWTRPITIAWHYGWYNRNVRPPGSQTCRLKGGNYRSFDPDMETTFNNLKNEFGITVDALSWIPNDRNRHNQINYRRGFLNASNVDTRYVALLYESTISLPLLNDRIDFSSSTVKTRFLRDVENMARFLCEIRDESPARVFTLDGRPVVFIFGSHTWGLFPVYSREFREVERLVTTARERFAEIYGTTPYLVGEEILLSPSGVIPNDRLQRAIGFDAIYIYHHASNLKRGFEETLSMSDLYIENQLRILRQSYSAFSALKNRYTERPILVIPNLAPGFAKPGHPTLQIGRRHYADFMKRMHQFHVKEYIRHEWAQLQGTTLLPAPIYVVGSWNEEFEGHAVFPYDFNFSVPRDVQNGFDLVLAIKESFGWNHYAYRDIIGTTPPSQIEIDDQDCGDCGTPRQ